MLAYQDTDVNVANIYRNDISTMSNNNYQDKQASYDDEPFTTSRTRNFLKNVAKLLLSHIGLVGLVVVYAVAGGFLFELLEQHQEKLNCQEAQSEQAVEITKLKQKLVSYVQYNTTTSTLTTLTYSTARDNETIAYSKIRSMLYDYRDFIITTGAKHRYYGDDCSVINKWTYPNSLLFAITIITTIGFGNITPMTWEGQMCCICYATIGIPIFLLCVTNLSGVLGEMFRLLYAHILCRPCRIIKKRREMARIDKLQEESRMTINRTNIGSWTINDDNEDNYKNNDYSTEHPTNHLTNKLYLDEESQQDNRQVTIPLTITMLIIVAYIWVGSLIFHSFEKWSMTEAGYFCFITLATIGFGDFVPGQRQNDTNATAKLIVGAIYVLFGMAILAMCFDLMQEEIVAKFRWLGCKLGVSEREEGITANKNDKAHTTHRRSSVGSSVGDLNLTIKTRNTMIDDGDEWSIRRSSSRTRQHSFRSNINRVHPMAASSNEGTLHQRATATKIN